MSQCMSVCPSGTNLHKSGLSKMSVGSLTYFVVQTEPKILGLFFNCNLCGIPTATSALNNYYFSFRIDLENVGCTPAAAVAAGPCASILHSNIINLRPSPV